MTERDKPDLSDEDVTPLEFVLHGVTYTASGTCPGGVVLDLQETLKNATDQDSTLAMVDFLDAVLTPESAEHFASNMRVGQNPITLKEINKTFEWLIEKYVGGDRPTEPVSDSSGGSPETGENSEAPSSSTADGTPAPVTSLRSSTLRKSSSSGASTTKTSAARSGS